MFTWCRWCHSTDLIGLIMVAKLHERRFLWKVYHQQTFTQVYVLLTASNRCSNPTTFFSENAKLSVSMFLLLLCCLTSYRRGRVPLSGYLCIQLKYLPIGNHGFSLFIWADFAGLPDTFLSAVKSGEVSVHADIHLQTPGPKHGAALKNGSLYWI